MTEKVGADQLVENYVLKPQGIEGERAEAVLQKGKEAAESKTEKTAKVDRIKALSEMDLDVLKNEVNDQKNFREFLSLSDLSAVPTMEVACSWVPKFSVGSLDKIVDAIYAKLDGGKLAAVKEMLKIENDADLQAIKDAIAKIYANQVGKVVQANFAQKYPRYEEFVAKNSGKTLKVSVSFGGGGEIKPAFEGQEFDDAYNAYIEENKTPKTEAELAKEKADAAAAANKEKEDDAKAKELANTPVGKILGFLGYGNAPTPPDTLNGFQKVVKGMDPWILFALSFIPGYEKFGGGGDISGITDMFPPHVKAKLDSMKERMKTSKLAYVGPSAGAEQVAEYESFDADKFKKLVSGEMKMPEKGLVLGKEVDLNRVGIKELTLDFKNGGEVIIPKGVEVVLDGTTFKDDKGEKKLNAHTHTLKGKIPGSVVFKGAVAFVHPESTDQARV